MAQTEVVGGVVYEVGMDLTRFLDGQRRLRSGFGDIEGGAGRGSRSMDRLDRQMNTTGAAMNKLSALAASLAAALSVQQVAAYADAWTVLNNKIANSVKQGETQADVMQRIFDISQSTQSSLNGTATLYARLERGTRTLNTSTADLAKLTTIINQGFAVSGATAQEAESAIVQLSQGLASGVLRGEEFNSVSEQGSRLTNALADSLGVSLGQLRAMAAQGKLTNDVVVNGLLSQGDIIGKEFAKTTVSISQGLLVAGNNITKFFGENSTVKSFSALFRDSVVTMSENLDMLGGALVIVASVLGSRYVGALAMATKEKLKSAFAARQLQATEQAAAVATARMTASNLSATLETKNRAITELQLAFNLKQAAVSAEQAAIAEARLTAARATATGAVDNYNRALAANRIAQAATASGAGLVTKAMGLVGGPVGAAVLAASAVFYFSQRAKEARDDATALADSVNTLSSKFNEMSSIELSASIAKMSKSLPELTDAVDDAQKAFNKAQAKVSDYQREIERYGLSTRRGREASEALGSAQDSLAIETLNLQKEQNRLSQTQNAINIGRATLNGTMRQGIDLLRRDQQETSIAAGMMNKLGDAFNFAARSKQGFNSTSLKVDRPKNVQEYLDKLLDRVEIEGELNERLRAQLKAETDVRNLGGDKSAINLARERAGAEFDAQKAQENKKKAESAANSEGKKSATQAESIRDKLEKLRSESELLADSVSELTRAQQINNAGLSLGSSATKEQIRLAREYKAASIDNANAVKAEAAARKMLPEEAEKASYKEDMKDLKTALDAKRINQKQYDTTTLQMAQEHQVKLAKIRADQVISPLAEAAGQVDPIQALANEQAQKLALIKQYEAQRIISHDQANALITAADNEFRTNLINAQWEVWSQQNAATQAAAAAFDSFGQTAGNALTGILTGSMSVSDALRSIGSNMVSSVINSFVQMGIEWAKSAIIGQVGMSAAAASSIAQSQLIAASAAPAAALMSLATAGANAVPAQVGIGATVGLAKSLALTGALYNGGQAMAGGLYEVGEKNKPEIFQASNGSQYMIPGDNGRVISNKDLGGTGGGVVVYNNITNNSSANVTSTATDNGDGSVTIDTIVADIEQNGPIGQSIGRNYNASRRANE